ncbi:MAG: hypothetical protein EB059_09405 [Alphaproteobacteria bacterium]|nr:hypothetical protein [Alphaproteobacteria bacterium]
MSTEYARSLLLATPYKAIFDRAGAQNMNFANLAQLLLYPTKSQKEKLHGQKRVITLEGTPEHKFLCIFTAWKKAERELREGDEILKDAEFLFGGVELAETPLPIPDNYDFVKPVLKVLDNASPDEEGIIAATHAIIKKHPWSGTANETVTTAVVEAWAPIMSTRQGSAPKQHTLSAA